MQPPTTQIAELALDARAQLGEGPLWDPVTNTLLWVDILGRLVHRFHPETGKDHAFIVSSDVGTVVTRVGGGLMLAEQRGFTRVEVNSEMAIAVGEVSEHPTTNRFNDGKCDPAGRLWAGTMAYDTATGAGKLYRLDPNGRITVVARDITIANGLAWDCHRGLFYHIDSPTRCIFAYDYDHVAGTIANRRVAVRCGENDGFPDGMAMDVEGMLWVAHWGSSQVIRWNPRTGTALQRISVPVSQPSACAFGGPRLDRLYITSARVDLDSAALAAQPHAGGLFVTDPGITGIHQPAFAG